MLFFNFIHQNKKSTFISLLKHSTRTTNNILNMSTISTKLKYHQIRKFYNSSILYHGSHKHEHHQEDVSIIKSEQRTKQSKDLSRITYIGAFVNVGLVVSKFIAGIVGNSTALIADASHSLSDLVSDFATMIVLKISSKQQNEVYPYGYGKFESLGTLGLSSILLATGFGIGYHAFNILINVDQEIIPTHLALGVAFISIISKELLFQVTASLGKKYNSKLIIANAWHHRADALTSLVALIGIIGARSFFPLLDPVAGMFVSALIIRMGLSMGVESIHELTDRQVDDKVFEEIKSFIKSYNQIEEVINLKMRRSGTGFFIELSVYINPNLSINEAINILNKLKLDIYEFNKSIVDVTASIDIPKTRIPKL